MACWWSLMPLSRSSQHCWWVQFAFISLSAAVGKQCTVCGDACGEQRDRDGTVAWLTAQLVRESLYAFIVDFCAQSVAPLIPCLFSQSFWRVHPSDSV
jgi:hypothetical protein